MKTKFMSYIVTGLVLFMLSLTHVSAELEITLAPPKKSMSWTVKFTYSEPPVVATKSDTQNGFKYRSRVKKEDYALHKKVLKINRYFVDGSKAVAYQFGGFQYQELEDTGKVYSKKVVNTDIYADNFIKSFPGVDWVSLKNFIEVTEAFSKKSAHFRIGAIRNKDESYGELNEVLVPEREAWFDLESGLPLGYRNGTTLAEYKINLSPTGNITIPMNIRKAIEDKVNYERYLESRRKPSN